MPNSICGADCANCPFSANCKGCRETGGQPFGKSCALAACCLGKGQEHCGQCGTACGLKAPLLAECNALDIPDMAEVTDLNALVGSFVNLAYPLPNGQTVKLLEDEKIYLGSQVEKVGSSRRYGLVASEDFLLVSEYGADGSDPEIILYKKRKK